MERLVTVSRTADNSWCRVVKQDDLTVIVDCYDSGGVVMVVQGERKEIHECVEDRLPWWKRIFTR